MEERIRNSVEFLPTSACVESDLARGGGWPRHLQAKEAQYQPGTWGHGEDGNREFGVALGIGLEAPGWQREVSHRGCTAAPAGAGLPRLSLCCLGGRASRSILPARSWFRFSGAPLTAGCWGMLRVDPVGGAPFFDSRHGGGGTGWGGVRSNGHNARPWLHLQRFYANRAFLRQHDCACCSREAKQETQGPRFPYATSPCVRSSKSVSWAPFF